MILPLKRVILYRSHVQTIREIICRILFHFLPYIITVWWFLMDFVTWFSDINYVTSEDCEAGIFLNLYSLCILLYILQLLLLISIIPSLFKKVKNMYLTNPTYVKSEPFSVGFRAVKRDVYTRQVERQDLMQVTFHV